MDQKGLLVLEISTKIVQNFRKVMEKGGLKILDPPKTMDLTDLPCQRPKSTLLLGPSYVFVIVWFCSTEKVTKRVLFDSKSIKK